MQGMGPQLRQWMPRLALLAAVVLVFVGRGLLTPEPPEQRLRGGNEAAKVAHSISLQAAIESATGELRAVGDGAGFIPGEGLIFRFEVKENGQLSLWESTPAGQWSLVIRKDVGASAEPVELRDEAGTLQRWVPEHGPGSYRYLAILADGNATVDPERLWTHAGEAEKDSKTAAVASKGILGWDRLQLELRRETAAPAVGPENHP